MLKNLQDAFGVKSPGKHSFANSGKNLKTIYGFLQWYQGLPVGDCEDGEDATQGSNQAGYRAAKWKAVTVLVD